MWCPNLHVMQLRNLSRFAPVALAFGMFAPSVNAAEPLPAPAATESEAKIVAAVKVEIRQESGSVVKGDALLDWNEDGTVSIEHDGTQHDLAVRLDRSGNSKKLSVTLAYTRGGEDVVAPYTFDAKIKKREVLRVEGNLAIAITVTPKKAAPEKPPEPKKPRLETGDDSDDPLAGLK